MNLTSPALVATRDRLVLRFGRSVEPWWDRLPDTLDVLASRWQLTIADAVGRGDTARARVPARNVGRRLRAGRWDERRLVQRLLRLADQPCRGTFEQVLADPDSLADVPGAEPAAIEAEGFWAAVHDAYEQTYGSELPVPERAAENWPAEPAGEQRTTTSLMTSTPRLTAKTAR